MLNIPCKHHRFHRHVSAAPAAVAAVIVTGSLALVAARRVEAAQPQPIPSRVQGDEVHLSELHQLTFGGENAEAYWSSDGRQLVFQARAGDAACDRIYRMAFDPAAQTPPRPVAVSSGQGATTCSYFLPGDQEVLYASTHLGGPSCPPRPDHSHGYVWALHSSYDIFRASLGHGPDDRTLTRLTDTPGYDAEATVCPRDGSIIFTSTRDGDLELYRMDKDGKNVKRLTHTPGYDGGAFFSPDCSRIVWRASRPRPGPELAEYQRLLAQGLVRPTKLELYVANADGSEAMQLTYLDAASFAPAWHPSGRRILFSSNHGDPRGREFDLWAINVDGSGLERITTAPGFDGFPLFSPDGRYLAFSSNRATAAGAHDTNVFVARWVEAPARGTPLVMPDGADRVHSDIAWLADPVRQGRGIETPGLAAAGGYVEQRFRELGLQPADPGDAKGAMRQPFPVVTRLSIDPATHLIISGERVAASDFVPLGFSRTGELRGELVMAGYGIVAPELGVDDYAGRDVRDKLVLVRRFVPSGKTFADTAVQQRYGDLRYKAWLARERGAKAILFVDWPEPIRTPASAPATPHGGSTASGEEARLPPLRPEGFGESGIGAVMIKRAAIAKVTAALERGQRVPTELHIMLTPSRNEVFNVVAKLPAGAPAPQRLPGVVILGAHYDHLGLGGPYSLAPDEHVPHVGADDNASGTAALLEVARLLKTRQASLQRDVIFIAFSAEEEGVLGSTHFTRHPPRGVALDNAVAMLNMDMVGRLRQNQLSVLGSASASEWSDLVMAACQDERLGCSASGDGYGPSDQTPFYAAGVPVLHFFTGAHSDYHKPSDVAERINAAGTAAIARLVSRIAEQVASRTEPLHYQRVAAPPPRGDLRSSGTWLGTIPDYVGPADGQPGVLLAGVRSGGPAEQAGMQRGDVLIRLGAHDVKSVEDMMYALARHQPGQTVTAVVRRDGKEVPLQVTFQHRR